MTKEQFERLFLPMGGQLYRVAFHLLGTEDDARDALQDLFVKLWTSREALSGVVNPGGYAMTLMKNVCLDRLLAGQLRQHEDLDTLTAEPMVAGSDRPDRRLEQRETLDRVLRLIDRLPQHQREVVRLRVLEEKEYAEIAALTGMSQGNVRVQLSLARQTLRNKLRINRQL